MGNIFWLTANSGSGKTMLAKAAQKKFKNIIVLDGDEMRRTICQGLGLSSEGRKENNLRIARLANLLAAQGHQVVVSVIAPYQEVRDEVDAICGPFWIYLLRKQKKREDYPYEVPKKPDLIIHNKEGEPEKTIERFILFLQKTPYVDQRQAPAGGNA